MLLVFVHNFQNRIDLRNGACLFRTFTCPTLFMKDPDILYEILGVLRHRCRDLFGMDTIVEVIFWKFMKESGSWLMRYNRKGKSLIEFTRPYAVLNVMHRRCSWE